MSDSDGSGGGGLPGNYVGDNPAHTNADVPRQQVHVEAPIVLGGNHAIGLPSDDGQMRRRVEYTINLPEKDTPKSQ